MDKGIMYMRRVFRKISSILKFHKISPEEKLRRECEVKGGVEIEAYSKIQRWHNKSQLIIEDGCVLVNKHENNLAGILHECRFVLQNENALIHIGEHCGLSGVTIMCAKKVILGRNVALGANVIIYDNDMHAINPYLRQYDNDNNIVAKEVVIDDHVWVGANSIILKGVHIGRGACIGAGSVVTKDVPPLTIYAGNPAKYIRDVEITAEQYQQIFGNN